MRLARDAAQAAIDVAQAELGEKAVGLSQEQILRGPLADTLGQVSETMSAYAARLAALDAPAELAASRELHVAELSRAVGVMDAAQLAAAAGDAARLATLEDAVDAIFAELAASLAPAYADVAFLSPFSSEFSFVGVFGTLDAAELDYIAAVQEALREFETRNAEFSRAISQTYASTDALLAALYDAGAGNAFAAVRSRAAGLDPPARFADSHRRWLDRLEGPGRSRPGDRRRRSNRRRRRLRRSECPARLVSIEEPHTLEPAFAAAIAPRGPLSAALELRPDLVSTPTSLGSSTLCMRTR